MDSRVRARPAAPSYKQRLDADGEPLVELLWQDGAVVAQAQAQAATADTQRRSVGGGAGGDPGAVSGVTGEEINEAAAAWLFPDGGGRDLYYSQLWHSITDADAGAGTLLAGSGEPAGSSFCGSNAVTVPAQPHQHHPLPQPGEDEPAASSAGGRALSKRSRDELDSRSEDAECEAVYETRSSRRPTAKRRTRAAEVHNQSERRRRDRINEKMKSLQELVPHCNKTDKASILDEAIEYLKSLQLQLQIMWMTTGVAPMMFTGGAHQLMPPMAMGLNSACLPAAQSLSQLQRVPPGMNNPLPNQMHQGQPPNIYSLNVENQMGNNGGFEPKNPFLHLNSTTSTTAAQVPGLFPYGPQMAQQKEIHDLLASTATPAYGPGRQSSSEGTGT